MMDFWVWLFGAIRPSNGRRAGLALRCRECGEVRIQEITLMPVCTGLVAPVGFCPYCRGSVKGPSVRV